MRSQSERQMLELGRLPGEWHNSGRNDYSSRFPGFAIFESQSETRSIFLHAVDFS